jgi:hypothetical protein
MYDEGGNRTAYIPLQASEVAAMANVVERIMIEDANDEALQHATPWEWFDPNARETGVQPIGALQASGAGGAYLLRKAPDQL